MVPRLVLTVLFAACCSALKAEEDLPAEPRWPDIDFTIQTEFASKYIFRGTDIYDDRPAIQGGIWAEFSDAFIFTRFWGSACLVNREEVATRELDRVEIDIAFRPRVWWLDIGVGHIYYMSPSRGERAGFTAEVYGDVRMHMPLPPEIVKLSVYGMIAYDFDQGNDFYARGGVDAEVFALNGPVKLAFTGGAWVGYNHGQFDFDSAISDVDTYAGIGVEYEWFFARGVGHFTLTPEDTINPHDDYEVWFKVIVGAKF